LNEFELEKRLIIMSTDTYGELLKKSPDAIALYMFYYYTAKWQGTNQPKATPSYCMKGLKWGEIRFAKADKILKQMGLIEKISAKDEQGKIIGWYVKLNYIWKTQTVKNLKTRTPSNPPSGFKGINALNDNNINALSVIDKSIKQSFGDDSINQIISSFKREFGSEPMPQKQQRYYCKHLLNKHTLNEILNAIKFARMIIEECYAPVITTPKELYYKWNQLKAFYARKVKNGPRVIEEE